MRLGKTTIATLFAFCALGLIGASEAEDAFAGGGKQPRVWKLALGEPLPEVTAMTVDQRDGSVLLAVWTEVEEVRDDGSVAVTWGSQILRLAGNGLLSTIGEFVPNDQLRRITRLAVTNSGDIYFIEQWNEDDYALRRISARDSSLSIVLVGAMAVPIEGEGDGEIAVFTQLNPINLITRGDDVLVGDAFDGRHVWQIVLKNDGQIAIRSAFAEELPEMDCYRLFRTRAGFGILTCGGRVLLAEAQDGRYTLQQVRRPFLSGGRLHEMAFEDERDGSLLLTVVSEREEEDLIPLRSGSRLLRVHPYLVAGEDFGAASDVGWVTETQALALPKFQIPQDPSGVAFEDAHFVGPGRGPDLRHTTLVSLSGGGFFVSDPDRSYLRIIGRSADEDDRLFQAVQRAVEQARQRNLAPAHGLRRFLAWRFEDRYDERDRLLPKFNRCQQLFRRFALGALNLDDEPRDPAAGFGSLPIEVCRMIELRLSTNDGYVTPLIARSAYELLEERLAELGQDSASDVEGGSLSEDSASEQSSGEHSPIARGGTERGVEAQVATYRSEVEALPVDGDEAAAVEREDAPTAEFVGVIAGVELERVPTVEDVGVPAAGVELDRAQSYGEILK